METMATLPEQLRLVMPAMLPNTSGGHRPVGIFASPRRLRGGGAGGRGLCHGRRITSMTCSLPTVSSQFPTLSGGRPPGVRPL
eukprot:7346312-Pyramimonas_sp.AAC.1